MLVPFGTHVRDKDGTLLHRNDREHYFVGYDRPEKHTGFFRLALGSAQLTVSPGALEALRGKRLSLEQVPGVHQPEQSRAILVCNTERGIHA